MRKAALFLVASVVLAVVGALPAQADSISSTSNGSSFQHNDTLNWGTLGNNLSVNNNTVATSGGGLATTIDFNRGGPGSTAVECPGTQCSWMGNFSPGQTLLSTVNLTTGQGQGSIDLSFSQGIGGVGFQIQPNSPGEFQAEIAAYDGTSLLGIWYETGNSTRAENNSAIFFGLEDFTGADITSIRIDTFNCEGGKVPNCSSQFAINDLRLWEHGPYPGTPEPASLLLLASGLGALGLLRRKLATN